MPDPKYSPREEQGTAEPATSYIRTHEAENVAIPPNPTPGVQGATRDVEAFLEDWALRHFTISVKLHDVARVSEGDAERQLVLEDLGMVQGVLLEVHDFVTADDRVRAIMRNSDVLQNGVSALYGWLEDVLEAASRLRVTQGKPGFDDTSDAAFAAILRTLERVHPDLEVLLRLDATEAAEDVAQKLALCFRQIGAAVVRVSGRAGSSYPSI